VIYNKDYSILAWINQVNDMQEVPYVHSVSYGLGEGQQTGVDYKEACNIGFMKAGLRGVSLLFAGGDQGACGQEGCPVATRPDPPTFHPTFPASSPYVTAVGATDFQGDDVGPEAVAPISGGGFSDVFGIPDYQMDAVAQYKNSPDANLPLQRFWNDTGRGFPDVAALGGRKVGYCIYAYDRYGDGKWQHVSGTSASAPVVAGVFARLNGLRLAAGLPPLGFLNPFIYRNPSGFQDVTVGCNDMFSQPGCPDGFTAVKGWDPATGWGTPDYEALASLVMDVVHDASVAI
jgi:tripeptidyl-peptidase-1